MPSSTDLLIDKAGLLRFSRIDRNVLSLLLSNDLTLAKTVPLRHVWLLVQTDAAPGNAAFMRLNQELI